MSDRFEGWAILEVMGHRRLGGFVADVEMFGARMCRIDVPGEDGRQVTQFYGGSSVFALTPTTEELARAVARGAQPQPVHRYELPPPPRHVSPDDRDDDDQADDEDGAFG